MISVHRCIKITITAELGGRVQENEAASATSLCAHGTADQADVYAHETADQADLYAHETADQADLYAHRTAAQASDHVLQTARGSISGQVHQAEDSTLVAQTATSGLPGFKLASLSSRPVPRVSPPPETGGRFF